ncbi:ABC transporter ATP-binding protein/permease [Nocardiopsis exhalans]|uniref:ABC transporter ATP-binding protein/permease n=1 Tax=Nocardiopsis exhalans TaxID=163604 RepID=A0ABY5DBX6_9ACTN|nr:ABC transporter ATP-binding protein [Nocardiopsis exhalans]USY21003.1 ABC transporter ATP-binding protein/permease [Nocardiopsis exhalans]
MEFFRNRTRPLRPLRDAGPAPVLSLFAVRLAERLVPPLTALALAALVTEISPPVSAELFTAALVPILLLALVLLAGHLGESAAAPLEYLVKSRVDGAHRSRVARMAASAPGIAALESPEARKLLREVRADPDHGVETTPGDGAVAVLKWVCGLLGAVVTCAILLQYAWWAVPLILIPVIVNRTVRFRQSATAADHWRLAIKGETHADVWRNATVSPAEGKDVRVFGLTDWMVERMQGHIREANQPLWSHVTRVIRLQWLSAALMVAGLLPVYLLVTADAVGGAATVAVQTAVLAAGWSLFQSLGSALELHHMAGAAEVARSTDRLRQLLAGPEAADGTRPGLPAAVPERVRVIRFEGVRFAYPGTEREVLDGVDLEIRTDELLAVVGLNGAGKSTLIKLLSGLYRPTGGRITADGVDLAETDPEEWRARLSVIFQDSNRYELTARENVLLGAAAGTGGGSGAAEEADLRAAAVEAGFVPVLERLPDGWDTPLARSRTGGVDLSGGQWQQLMLARALYAVRRGANLIVADEPTAHLDVRTEFELFGRLAERRRDTGIVLISHRLSTVRRADRIVLLDGGRITESGTHEELMERGGVYARMFAVQAQRFRSGPGGETAESPDAAEREDRV